MESTNNSQNQSVPVIAPLSPSPRKKHVGRWLTFFAILLVVGTVSALTLLKNDESTKVSAAPAGVVSITPQGFEPQTIKIKKGQSLTWVNQDDKPHHVVADPFPSGDSLKSLNSIEPLTRDDSYTAVFEKMGTFTYHDQLDPVGFKATVIVE
jgi:plastocyanin